MHQSTLLLATMFLLLILSGCTGSGNQALQYSMPSDTSEVEDYRIGPEDKLHIEVFLLPDLTRDVVVTEHGIITLPLVGNAKVSGLTRKAAEDLIAQKYNESYLQNPSITLSVLSSASRWATVYGYAKSPGVYPLKGRTTLMNLLALSGGVQDTAETSEIMLLRNNGTDTKDVYHYNLVDITDGSIVDPHIESLDVIVIDQDPLKVAGKIVMDVFVRMLYFKPF